MWSNLSRYSQIVAEAYSRGKIVGGEMAAVMKSKMADTGVDIDWKSHRQSVLKAPLAQQALGTISVVPFVFPVIHDLFTLTSSPLLLSGQAIYAGCLISYLGGYRGGRVVINDVVKLVKEGNERESEIRGEGEGRFESEERRGMMRAEAGGKQTVSNHHFEEKLNEDKRKVKERGDEETSTFNENDKGKKSERFYLIGNHSLGDFNDKTEEEIHNKQHLQKCQALNQNMGNSVMYKYEESLGRNYVKHEEDETSAGELQSSNYNLGVSVVPVMIACLGLPQATTLCSVLLMSGMTGLTYVDMKDATYPPWLKSMRFLVTAVGVSSMSLTLLFSFIMPLSP